MVKRVFEDSDKTFRTAVSLVKQSSVFLKGFHFSVSSPTPSININLCSVLCLISFSFSQASLCQFASIPSHTSLRLTFYCPHVFPCVFRFFCSVLHFDLFFLPLKQLSQEKCQMKLIIIIIIIIISHFFSDSIKRLSSCLLFLPCRTSCLTFPIQLN